MRYAPSSPTQYVKFYFNLKRGPPLPPLLPHVDSTSPLPHVLPHSRTNLTHFPFLFRNSHVIEFVGPLLLHARPSSPTHVTRKSVCGTLKPHVPHVTLTLPLDLLPHSHVSWENLFIGCVGPLLSCIFSSSTLFPSHQVLSW
jgi:hypothetical protein